MGIGNEARSPLLLMVEGRHDMEFLRRISGVLNRHDPVLPDLRNAERMGAIVFIPVGGGALWSWASRLAQLRLPEFHLYDRETSPETESRQLVVQAINVRPKCRVALTNKRGLENYLHPRAIQEAGGIEVDFTDDDSVADVVARAGHRISGGDTPWEELTSRARKRQRERAKRWLNTRAVECMSAQRLNDRDPQGEIRSWLEAIASLLNRAS